MTLKERLEENIVVLAVAVAIGTGGTVYGVSAYFCQQHMDSAALAHQNDMSALTNKSDEEIRHIRHDYDEAITELKNRVSSIERRLGGEKYLDVNSLFRSKQEEQTTKYAQYFPDGQFFAQKDSDKWKFQKTDELALMSEIVGGLKEGDLPDKAGKALSGLPMYLWRGQGVFDLQGVSVAKIFPFIAVEIIDHDKLSSVGGIFESDDKSAEEASRFLGSQLRNDAPSVFLSSFISLQMQMSAMDNHIKFYIRNIQKVGRVMYVQIFITFENIRVNGVDTD